MNIASSLVFLGVGGVLRRIGFVDVFQGMWNWDDGLAVWVDWRFLLLDGQVSLGYGCDRPDGSPGWASKRPYLKRN